MPRVAAQRYLRARSQRKENLQGGQSRLARAFPCRMTGAFNAGLSADVSVIYRKQRARFSSERDDDLDKRAYREASSYMRSLRLKKDRIVA